jgi:hypothetical protein
VKESQRRCPKAASHHGSHLLSWFFGGMLPLAPQVAKSMFFSFPKDFTYKILRALTRTEADAAPTFSRLPRALSLRKYFNDPTSGGSPVGNGPILQEVLDVISMIAICVHPDPVVGFDNL